MAKNDSASTDVYMGWLGNKVSSAEKVQVQPGTLVNCRCGPPYIELGHVPQKLEQN